MTMPSFLTPYRRGMVWLVALIGVGMSLLMWRYALTLEAERTQAAFLSRAQTQASVAKQHLRSYREMVYSLRDSFLGQNTVTREEFATVATSLIERHPGVQALEWVQIVSDAQRDMLEKRSSAELGKPFVFKHRDASNLLQTAPVAPEYFVINYVEPLAGNEAVLGYDVRTAPSAPLLHASREDGKFRVSQTFRLAQSAEGQFLRGIVFILPFFRPSVPGNPAEGFVQGVFLVDTMLAQSHDLSTNEALDSYYIDLQSGDGKPELLYANIGGSEPLENPGARVELPPLDDPRDFRTTLTIGERTWLLVIRKNAAWTAKVSTRQPLLILGGALFFTGLLALFINSLLQRTGRIEQEVRERTRQLHESEARLQDIMDHSPALIFVKDLAGKYQLCNELFMRVCRRPRSEIIGRTDQEIFPAELAKLYRQNDEAVMAAGRPMEFEETGIGPEGVRTCLVQKFPLLDDNGRTYALCGIATDITDRLAAAQEKLQLERQFLETQKLESLGVLAGGIAHDFNNILTAILGNATLSNMELAGGHPAREHLEHIEIAARRARDLCAQMLAYAGKASFVIAPVNLSSLVSETTALLEVSVAKRARLELNLAPDLPAISGDATQLRQIIMNLVINAADATNDQPDGLITVQTSYRELTASFFKNSVNASDHPDGRYVGLEVRDNGSGMPPDVLARIFEPFFTTKFSGRGLGLAAVLGIVQRHQGAVFIESAPGQGTVFRLFFPAVSGTAANTALPFPVSPQNAPLQATILIVDDEDGVRHVAGQALKHLGVTPLGAASGQAALDLINRPDHKIDLVMLDLTMPGMSGEETLRQLRTTHPGLKVVIMSGYSGGDTMQRCAALGVTDYLTKPFEIADLIQILRKHLG
jgi:two-component system, cell cycle sensor histidine kinase and response regulator CckA